MISKRSLRSNLKELYKKPKKRLPKSPYKKPRKSLIRGLKKTFKIGAKKHQKVFKFSPDENYARISYVNGPFKHISGTKNYRRHHFMIFSKIHYFSFSFSLVT